MISDPYIQVECDRCGSVTDTYPMTLLASGCWDDRNLARKMARDGWEVRDGQHICLACIEEEHRQDAAANPA